MNAYLLTWNPKRSIEEHWNTDVQRLAAGDIVQFRWSSGNNKGIQIGDRVFLLRQGSDRPGLVGAGWITRDSYQDQHWDATKRAQGRKGWFINVRWDSLVVPDECLSSAKLLKGILPAQLLKVACSGVTIKPDLAVTLENGWAAHRGTSFNSGQILAPLITAWEGDFVEYRSYRRKRDQKLRDAALCAANGICAVCEIDYSKILNGNGIAVLQVHHKRQLSQLDTPSLNSTDDLAVVCANCHCLIHMNAEKALAVGILKTMLQASK